MLTGREKELPKLNEVYAQDKFQFFHTSMPPTGSVPGSLCREKESEETYL